MLRASVVLTFVIATFLTGIGVGVGIGLKAVPALDRALDVGRRHRPFLDEAVGEHRRGCAVEEIENAVVLALEPDPQLVLSRSRSASGRRSSWPRSAKRSMRTTHLSCALGGKPRSQSRTGAVPLASQ